MDNNIENNAGIGIQFVYDENEDLLSANLSGDDCAAEHSLSKLSNEEEECLAECVRIIDEGWEEFHSVTRALYDIKIKKLYRETHHSFEAFCEEKWGISRVHGDRLCHHQEMVEELKCNQIGAVPKTESASRTLTGLTKEQRAEVSRKVKETKGDRHTAKDWQAEAEKVAGKNKRTGQKPKSKFGERSENLPVVVSEADKQTDPASLEKLLGTVEELERVIMQPDKEKAKKLIERIKQQLKIHIDRAGLNQAAEEAIAA